MSLSVPSSSANSICTAGGIGRETIPYCFNMNAKGAETITFPVVPMRAGKSKVRVVIGTAFGGDGVEREITVEVTVFLWTHNTAAFNVPNSFDDYIVL